MGAVAWRSPRPLPLARSTDECCAGDRRHGPGPLHTPVRSEPPHIGCTGSAAPSPRAHPGLPAPPMSPPPRPGRAGRSDPPAPAATSRRWARARRARRPCYACYGAARFVARASCASCPCPMGGTTMPLPGAFGTGGMRVPLSAAMAMMWVGPHPRAASSSAAALSAASRAASAGSTCGVKPSGSVARGRYTAAGAKTFRGRSSEAVSMLMGVGLAGSRRLP